MLLARRPLLAVRGSMRYNVLDTRDARRRAAGCISRGRPWNARTSPISPLNPDIVGAIRADRADRARAPASLDDANVVRRDGTLTTNATLTRPAFARDIEKILTRAGGTTVIRRQDTGCFSFVENDDIWSPPGLCTMQVGQPRAARGIGSLLGLNCEPSRPSHWATDVGHTPFGPTPAERRPQRLLHARTGRILQPQRALGAQCSTSMLPPQRQPADHSTACCATTGEFAQQVLRTYGRHGRLRRARRAGGRPATAESGPSRRCASTLEGCVVRVSA